MTDPKETPSKLTVRERTPRKRTSDPFPNLRRPAALTTSDAVEEIMGLTPTPAETPVDTGVATGVATGVGTGVTTPVETPVALPPSEPRRERDQYLDATHTASEKSIYSVMYR